MTSYLVTWQIDIDADSPYEAAQKARQIQIDPESTATCFDVASPDLNIQYFDLSQGE